MDPQPPGLVILMGTLDGARWLPDQLASLRAQTWTDWVLRVSDDGSTDTTLAVLAAFRDACAGHHDVQVVPGPRQGAGQNMLSLLLTLDLPLGPDTHAAFSDQDDVWLPEKLARAMAALAVVEPGRPGIYGARWLLMGPEGQPLGESRRPRRPPDLGNAVVQNMVSGHSMVLNPAAVALARAAGLPMGVAFHDWWLSLLVLAAGGRVVLDDEPVLRYRQHGANVMGSRAGGRAAWRRLRLMLGRDYAGWIEANLDGLRQAAARGVALTPEATALLDGVGMPGPGLSRPLRLARAGVRRQSTAETAFLYLGAALGRA